MAADPGAPLIRLFVSSTFADLRAERQLLQTRVFPMLEEYCAERGARFQAIDLRWGIPEDQQLVHRTMRICLDEIDRCQRASPKPNLLILLGDRYGWQPVPDTIPAAEMDAIREEAPPGARQLIDEWFLLDTNAVPPEYCLQPRGDRYARFEDWQPVETRLRSALRTAVERVLPTRIADYSRYMLSATHQEIQRGLAGLTSADGTPLRDHVFAYARRPRGSRAPDDAPLGELTSYLSNQLTPIGHFRQFDRADEAFANLVAGDLVKSIDARLRDLPVETDVDRERRLHRAHRDRVVRDFFGREDALDRLNAYVANPKGRSLIVTGEAGVGKSTVLAALAADLERRRATVVARFAGASARSGSASGLLANLAADLRALAGAPDPGPATLQGIVATASSAASAARPVTIVIDGADELRFGGGTLIADAGKIPLPPHVGLIVSTSGPASAGAKTYDLPWMTFAEATTLFDHWLARAGRRLTSEQRHAVDKARELSGLPLHYRLLFEQCRRLHSYDGPPALASNLETACDQWLNDLEREHGHPLVASAIGHLLAGRYGGLSEGELVDALAQDRDFWQAFLASCHPDHRDEVAKAGRLPVFVWSRLRESLEPHLGQIDSFGSTLLTLPASGVMRDALTRRYGAAATGFHERLARYFQGQALTFYNPDPQPNRRKLVELPWQLVTAGTMWDETIAWFRNVEATELAIRDGLWFEIFPVVMEAIGIARRQGEFSAANKLSDLIQSLIITNKAIGGPFAITPEQAAALAEASNRSVAMAEEAWHKHDPRALALANQGAELGRIGRIAEGDALLRQALTIDPDCELAHYNLAVSAYDRGDDGAVLTHLKEVLRINPHNRKAAEGIAKIERTPAQSLDSPKAFVRAAMEAVNLRGDSAKGAAILDQGLQKFPNDPALLRARESLRRFSGH